MPKRLVIRAKQVLAAFSATLMVAACAGGDGGATASPSPGSIAAVSAAPGAPAAPIGLEPAFPALSFDRPLDFQMAPGANKRAFVVEQAGVIRSFDPQSADQAPVFLDIKDRVQSAGNEEGLLGLAFHPQYAENRYFYVNYTVGNPRRNTISRFRAREGQPLQADPASEQVLISVPDPYSNHNGGCLRFGPDGFLYIGLGDGGAGGDPQGNGQKRTTLLGKLLRIDVNAGTAGRGYGIPADNPYAGNSEGLREEIWAYGLRNPWRFAFEPETGRLWCADVGQNRLEEIDLIVKGGNYGWNRMEGSECFGGPCDKTGLILPVAEYGRDLGQSVTGGVVYRGKRAPSLVGAYIYADFVTGRFWQIRHDGSNVTSNSEFMDSELNISSFGEDDAGEAYMTAFDGKIYRFK